MISISMLLLIFFVSVSVSMSVSVSVSMSGVVLVWLFDTFVALDKGSVVLEDCVWVAFIDSIASFLKIVC